MTDPTWAWRLLDRAGDDAVPLLVLELTRSLLNLDQRAAAAELKRRESPTRPPDGWLPP